MENKRIKSILGFNDPFILYNIDEKLMKMERDDEKEFRSNSNKGEQQQGGQNNNITHDQ